MVGVALLPTIYWYTPGRLPLTTRVLLYRAFIRMLEAGVLPKMVVVTSKAISNVSSSLIGSPFLVQKYSTGGPPLVSARRLNSGGLPVNVDAEATIATLFSVITPAPADQLKNGQLYNLSLC